MAENPGESSGDQGHDSEPVVAGLKTGGYDLRALETRLAAVTTYVEEQNRAFADAWDALETALDENIMQPAARSKVDEFIHTIRELFTNILQKMQQQARDDLTKAAQNLRATGNNE